MADFEMDFPANPTVGQTYTNSIGAVYRWNGTAWIIGFFVTPGFETLLDLLAQIRVLLMDTDPEGGFRYSQASLITDINQGLVEMYRMRPDIFLELNFKIPQYDDITLDAPITIEQQFRTALVYYTVGMAQLRDDEATQDQRASMFMGKFTSMLMAVA